MYVTAAMADFRLGGRIRQKLSVWGSRWSCTVLSDLKERGLGGEGFQQGCAEVGFQVRNALAALVVFKTNKKHVSML